MERKSGSSSRSPSLSRRPSLKDKKPTVISKSKKKGTPGVKKERWLLTRKTWRYMTDAVGNLLPEYRGGSRRGSSYPTASPPTSAGIGGGSVVTTTEGPQPGTSTSSQGYGSGTSRAGGITPPGHGVSMSPTGRSTVSPPGQQFLQQQQQLHQQQVFLHQQQILAQLQQQSHQGPSSFSSGGGRTTVSPTSSAFPWGSFPSHRPGVTPTGPGPGSQSSSISSSQVAPRNPRHPAVPIDPDDYPAIEKHFDDVCTKEKKFLLWTRTKPKGLSGPALRDQKLKQQQEQQQQKGRTTPSSPSEGMVGGGSGTCGPSTSREASGSSSGQKGFFLHHFQRHQSIDHNKENLFSPDYYSPEEEFGDEDDYDEYENEEEQVTVRERRKSSTASSTMSILGGPGMSFFRPLSTVSMSSGVGMGGGGSDTSYAMIMTPSGVQKILRNTGIQTDPFPEELLIRLRLQAVHEDRQKQLQMQLQGAQQGQQGQQMISGGFGGQGLHGTEGLNETESGGGMCTGSGGGGGSSAVISGSGSRINKGVKETVIPISHEIGLSPERSKDSSTKSGRESEEKILEKSSSDKGQSSDGKGEGSGSVVSSSAQESSSTTGTDVTDKKSEESGYSSSISDTVMRYLRMVRKNSKADNKETIDKFKTVNYDRSLRYIKSKNVTVEEALEHEKNKALGIGQGASPNSPPSPLPDLPGAIKGQGGQSTTTASATGTSSTAAPNAATGTVNVTTSKSPSGSTIASISPVGGQGQPSASSSPGPASPTPSGVPPGSTSSISQGTATTAIVQKCSEGKVKKGVGVETTQLPGAVGVADLSNIIDESDLPPDDPPPPPPHKECPSVGIQAGESLIRFLKNFNPTRKFSDFSSATSYCSSESPVEMTSPRYSIATTVMSSASEGENLYLQQHQAALASMMATGMLFMPGELSTIGTGGGSGSGVPTTARSSFDMYSAADSSEFDDAFNNYHLLYQQSAQFTQQQQLLQQQQQQQQYFQQVQDQSSNTSSYQQYSTSSSIAAATASSTLTTKIRKSSSTQGVPGMDTSSGSSMMTCPSTTSIPAGMTYSYSSSGSGGLLSQIQPGSSTTYSSRHHHHHPQHHHHHHHHQSHLGLSTTSSTSSTGGIGAGTKISASTPSTPIAGGSTSSSMSGSGGGGLMKSFFSSSPFSSSFGLGSKVGFGLGHKKPTSTTSLVTPSVSTPVTGHSSSNPLTLLDSSHLPPTTSSSPNLLSLIHSNSSSRTCPSVSGGSSGGSARELLSSSIPTVSSDVISKQQQKQQQRASTGASVSFKGSLVTQKGQMSLPVGSGENKSGPQGGSSSSSGGGGSCRPSSYTGTTSGLFNRGAGPETPQGATPSSNASGGDGSSGGGSGALMSNVLSAVMQKSKSSSSVLPLYGSGDQQRAGAAAAGAAGTPAAGHSTGGPSGASRLMSKSRIFKSRSKSSTRATTSSSGSATCSWAPQGRCKWKSSTGKTVSLEQASLLLLSVIEAETLQEVALEKLKSISLGVEIKVPKEKSGAHKPKRRPYLLKKKALSTGFFESGTKRDDGKESTAGSGLVFGISLSQVVANDRLKSMKAAVAAGVASTSGTSEWEQNVKRSQNGSRNSVASVGDTAKDKEERDLDDKLFWVKRGSVAAVDAIAVSAGDVLAEKLKPPRVAVPSIILESVRHLEKYGLHTTGIFRVSTSLKRIRQLREDFDGGKEVIFGQEHSPHDIAALLKEFLRDLPDPLLSRELYQPFLKTQKIRNRKQQLEAVQHLVQLLPVANRDTLAALLHFFAKVVDNANDTKGASGEILTGNRMESYSLSTLIAPNILPCMPSEGGFSSTDLTLTKERRESIDVVNYLICNYKQVFEVPSELLHDVYLHLMDTQPEGVESLLKMKSGLLDDAMDELETGSVFEGSESGELAEEEATVPLTTRVFRRREDILHEGAAKGGHSVEGATSRLERTRERCRGKRESSRERQSDIEKQQSGAESDSSSTKSTSRWFRRTRGDNKTRTSSDSGSEKVKGSKIRESSLHESKRASSLDSVNIKEPVTHGSSGTSKDDRQKSSSDQSLKVPDNYNRRQSSPVLESSGVITASLKIPVPVPLNIDDTDIPFIEDDQHEGAHHTSHIHSFHQRSGHHQQQSGKSRGRSASTDSSALVRTPSSSHTTTPISSPLRQPSSEVSSPVGFSPPGSPPYDPNTFPYEEMTARILIGAPSPGTSSASLQQSSYVQSSIPTPSLSTVTTSVSTSESKSAGSTPTIRPKVDNKVTTGSTSAHNSSGTNTAKVVTSLYLQPSANVGLGAVSAPVSPQPSISPSASSTSVYIPSVTEPKGLGKETKGANIGGLIKSKTADFEKLAKSSTTPAGTSTTSTYSIAPKMRLRSQDNIMLKQQFLLRQQQGEGGKSVRRSNSMSKEEGSGTTTTITTTTATGESSPSRSTGHRSLTRRRHLVGSASSSAIVSPGGDTHSTLSQHSATSSSHSPSASQPVSVTVRSSTVGSGAHQGQGTPPMGGSPSRWKRSEIIASRHQSQPTQDPETFV